MSPPRGTPRLLLPYTVAGMRLEQVVHTNTMSCSKLCSPQCAYLKNANEVGGGMRKANSYFQTQGRATRQTHKKTTKKVHRERKKTPHSVSDCHKDPNKNWGPRAYKQASSYSKVPIFSSKSVCCYLCCFCLPPSETGISCRSGFCFAFLLLPCSPIRNRW